MVCTATISSRSTRKLTVTKVSSVEFIRSKLVIGVVERSAERNFRNKREPYHVKPISIMNSFELENSFGEKITNPFRKTKIFKTWRNVR